jgi:ATP-dependent helicase HrpB
MNDLPIYEVIPDIKSNLKKFNTLILEAPPGAGKSTVVPISLLDEQWLNGKIIIMLEPRRVAARMVASQMSKLLKVGQAVGYQVKMDRCVSKTTKIIVVTEAILVRMLQADQELSNVAMIIFDEFHERSIHTDLSLALSLQVQELLRDDLKILLMSATLNSKELVKLIGDVPVISSQGRVFEVENIYLKANIKQPDFKSLNQLVSNTVISSIQEDEGDILVFLSGVKEINSLASILREKLSSDELDILPLYSSLSKKEQDKALQRSSKRKIILSTNISQTSLTIEGVRIVIDTGLEKLSRYSSENSMNHLDLNFISRDSSIQRAGRAGRLSNGKCYRLWHENKILEQSTKPEILRTDLSSTILDLALWGVESFDELKWLDIPATKTINSTREVLQELQMIDENFNITIFGKEALSLGLHPRYSYMILKANEIGYGYEACLLSAILEERSIYTYQNRESDILTSFISLYEKDLDNKSINKYLSKEILKQVEFFYSKLKAIKNILKRKDSFNQEMISVLLLYAYPDRLAKQRISNGNKYKLSNKKGAILHNEDSLYNQKFLVVSNLHFHHKDSFITKALSISYKEIEEYFSHCIKQTQTVTYNKEQNKFDIKEYEMFFDLELSCKSISFSKDMNFSKLIIDLIKQEGLSVLSWSDKIVEFQNRVSFINLCDEVEYSFKDISLDFLSENLAWIEPYLEDIKSMKQLESLDIYNILTSSFTWEEKKLIDTLAPTHIKVPSGSNIKLDYSNNQTPILAVKIQEVFGLKQTPLICESKIKLQVHLLSPALRPIQITYDLESFWKNSYAEVRKELRGKYKRHYWPENPYEAVATKKTKKNM